MRVVYFGGLMQISSDELASMLANAHLDGWAEGHDLLPEPDPQEVFLGYLNEIEIQNTALFSAGQVKH